MRRADLTRLTAVLVVLLAAAGRVHAGGKVTMELVSYSNHVARDAGGGYCDVLWTIFKRGVCDPYFLITLNQPGMKAWPVVQTMVYRGQTLVLFDPRIGKHQLNPFHFHFARWGGRVHYNVTVMDYDHNPKKVWWKGWTVLHKYNPDDLMDVFTGTVSMATSRWFKSVSNSNGSPAQKGETRFRFKIRALCDEHYYGQDCSKHCEKRNDSGGHYTCTVDGDKVCLAGWTGPSTSCTRRLPK